MDYVIIYLLVTTFPMGLFLISRKSETTGWKLFALVTMALIGWLGWLRFGGGA
jgi:hypothetical protein